MEREVIHNKVHLKSDKGIEDKRTGRIHYEVVCVLRNEKYFVEVDDEDQT